MRLFSPCKCDGTMAYVHVSCLNTWRSSASNRKAFYRCENCHYKYNIKRTAWHAYLSNWMYVLLLSNIILTLIIVVSGMLLTYFDIAHHMYDFLKMEEPWGSIPSGGYLQLAFFSSAWSALSFRRCRTSGGSSETETSEASAPTGCFAPQTASRRCARLRSWGCATRTSRCSTSYTNCRRVRCQRWAVSCLR